MRERINRCLHAGHCSGVEKSKLSGGLKAIIPPLRPSDVSRAYNIQYDGSTTEFNVSSSAVRCLPVGNVLRMSNCVIIDIYVARRKQYHRLLLSHTPRDAGVGFTKVLPLPTHPMGY